MVKELGKFEEHSLIYWEHGTTKEYVVCSYFDETKEEGSMWCWGHYFDTYANAVKYFREVIGVNND